MDKFASLQESLWKLRNNVNIFVCELDASTCYNNENSCMVIKVNLINSSLQESLRNVLKIFILLSF